MKITQEEFDKLPGLLTRKLFLQLTGLNKNDLAGLVKARKIKLCRVRVYGRYYKQDAGRYLGFNA